MVQAPQALTVSAINKAVRKNLLDDPKLRNVWVIGEAINTTYHNSGHIYLTLRDVDSMLNCTFFSAANQHFSSVRIQNGERYFVFGSINTYAKRGTYQLNVTQIFSAGKGFLKEQVELLKQQLAKEGIFDKQHKQKLPLLPQNIGIVTALTGAAVQDVLSTLRQRNPWVNVLIANCLMQGENAASSIVTAIQKLHDKEYAIDVILVTRGGGSAEDLMALNDEKVVRAIFAAKIPVLSAIGHEIDHSLSDLVADASAKTPTEAAIKIITDYQTLLTNIHELRDSIQRTTFRQIDMQKERWIAKAKQFKNMYRLLDGQIQNRKQLLDELIRRQQLSINKTIENSYLALFQLEKSFQEHFKKKINAERFAYSILNERLKRLSIQDTLKRGFAIVKNHQNHIIRKASQTQTGENIKILLHQGKLDAEIVKTNKSFEFSSKLSDQ